jgi:hypothetical protein
MRISLVCLGLGSGWVSCLLPRAAQIHEYQKSTELVKYKNKH